MVRARTEHCAGAGTAGKAQAQHLQHDRAKLRRRCGRQCRGQGKVVVSWVRQTETQLREPGQPVGELAPAAQAPGQSATPLAEDQRERLATQLKVALAAQQQLATQSPRRTQGKSLSQGKIVKACDPPSAPIGQGQSNCPTQVGRNPGSSAEPAAGFSCACALPVGNPADLSSVVPLVTTGPHARGQVARRPTLALHARAGDLALHAPQWRATLPTRGILTVGIPHPVEPLSPVPTPEDVRQRLTEAGLHRPRTPHPAQGACAGGSSRPIVDSLLARLLGRGAARLTSKGQRGAIVQLGMTVRAHNAATGVRLPHNRLSTRAQKLRRLLRLKRHNPNEFNVSKN